MKARCEAGCGWPVRSRFPLVMVCLRSGVHRFSGLRAPYVLRAIPLLQVLVARVFRRAAGFAHGVLVIHCADHDPAKCTLVAVALVGSCGQRAIGDGGVAAREALRCCQSGLRKEVRDHCPGGNRSPGRVEVVAGVPVQVGAVCLIPQLGTTSKRSLHHFRNIV